MAGIDISDLPAPPKGADISDLPVPPKADGMKLTGDYHGFGSHSEAGGGGISDLIGGAVANVPYSAAHAVQDLYRRITNGDTKAPDNGLVSALHVNPTPEAQGLVNDVANSRPGQAVAGAAHTADRAIENFSPTLHDLQHQTAGVMGDVANVLPAVGAAKGVAGVADAAAAAQAARPAIERAGFSPHNPTGLATNIAGAEGQAAQAVHNQRLGNVVAAHEANVPHTTPLSAQTLVDARDPANAVYNRVGASLPPANLASDADAATRIKAAGSQNGGQITASPAQAEIRSLQAQLLDPNRMVTGPERMNEVRDLRQQAFSNTANDDVTKQHLGRAQIDMANAVEDHILRNIPQNADVTPDQFLAARKALAKSHTVQEALGGNNDVDMQKLARIQRADPALLDGGLGDLARFAGENEQVTQRPTGYTQPSLTSDVVGGVKKFDIQHPLDSISRIFGADTLARRALTGNTDKAVARTAGIYPQGPQVQLGPVSRPAPKQLTYQPEAAPTQLSAGERSGPASLFDELGLSPGTRAAAEAHPGAARPGVEPPEPRSMPEVGFFEQPNVSRQVTSSVSRDAQGGDIPLADLLSHGVERPAPGGLTLADELGVGGKPAAGVPFKVNAAHMAAGLDLADELGLNTLRNAHTDLPSVASQGVPEGIMQRTPKKPKFRAGDVVKPPRVTDNDT